MVSLCADAAAADTRSVESARFRAMVFMGVPSRSHLREEHPVGSPLFGGFFCCIRNPIRPDKLPQSLRCRPWCCTYEAPDPLRTLANLHAIGCELRRKRVHHQ